MYKNPSEYQIPYKEVNIITKDNLKLYGWFLYKVISGSSNQQIKNRPTFIYFHENAGNIGFRLPFCQLLYKKLQVNILVIGYRGYGYSEGIPTEQGLMLDSEAVLNYVFERSDTEIHQFIDKSNVYLFGRSLGGAVALYVSEKLKPNLRGIILENTFTSMGDMVDHIFPIIKHVKSILLKNKWESKDRIKFIRNPILFFSSERDELVPFHQMEELYTLAKLAVFKQKYLISNGTHNESWQLCIDEYVEQLKLFMTRCEESGDEKIESSINESSNMEEDSSLINEISGKNFQNSPDVIYKKDE